MAVATHPGSEIGATRLTRASIGIDATFIAAGRAVFVTQLVATVVGFPLVITLAVSDGAVGAAWGLFAQAAALAIASWATFRGALRAVALGRTHA